MVPRSLVTVILKSQCGGDYKLKNAPHKVQCSLSLEKKKGSIWVVMDLINKHHFYVRNTITSRQKLSSHNIMWD